MSEVELSEDLDKALEEYEAAFGEDYPLERETLGTAEKDAAEIRRRIKENTPVAPRNDDPPYCYY